jgi:hypothetical protein
MIRRAQRDYSRRLILAAAGLSPVYTWVRANAGELTSEPGARLVLSSFETGPASAEQGARWRGFTDRVMGGVSQAQFTRETVAGRPALRMTGRVTRDSGGGFAQMALDLGGNGYFDASGFSGLEFLVPGNDEDYSVHVRTADCGWHDESYRLTFHASPRWEWCRFAWTDFKANGVSRPLDPARLERIALLGWMREFTADLAVAELALIR